MKWRWMKENMCKPSLTLTLLSYKYPKVPPCIFSSTLSALLAF
jgi:hypothetical protein